MKITGLMAWAVTLGIFNMFIAVDLLSRGVNWGGVAAVFGALAAAFVFSLEVLHQSDRDKP